MARLALRKAPMPPGPHLVEHLVQEMCDYVNENFHEKTALHLAAYVMWRLNWIHPFSDGNGRTSRAVSYIVLCSHVKILLPGTSSIPQQIEENRAAYFRALEAADEALRETDEIDISVMEIHAGNPIAVCHQQGRWRREHFLMRQEGLLLLNSRHESKTRDRAARRGPDRQNSGPGRALFAACGRTDDPARQGQRRW
jgi:hypothetical protein